MNAFLIAAEWWTRTLWVLSWQIGVLVGVVWLASLVSRRASPNFRYWLWCIVLVRLCVPVSLALPAGISGDVRHALEKSAPAVLLATQRAVVSPEPTPAETGDSLPEAALDLSPQARAVPGGIPELSLNATLALGWTAISLCLLILVVMKGLRVRRMLQGWREVTRPELLLLVDSLRSKCAIGREVRVRILPAAQSSQGPALVGIMRPTILLPAPVAEHWSLDELEPVLLHELAHVKRWDLLVNLVQIVVQAVYFFHPLVWFVNARIRQERELVCDDLAVLHSGGRCKRYSQSFMRVLEETSNHAPLFGVAGVGMTEHRKPLARRIIRMMSKDYRIYRPLGWLSIALLLVVSAAAIAVAAERALPNGAGRGPAASGFVAALPGGGIIELIAVRRHEPGNTSFWRPDGTPLAEPPYDHVNSNVAAEGEGYEFVFRKLGINDDLPTRFHVDGASGCGNTMPLAKDGSALPALTVTTAFLGGNPAIENIQMDCASGDWRPALTHDPGESLNAGYSGDGYFAAFAGLYEKDNAACVTVTLSDRIVESAWRLIAMDKSGRSHTGSTDSVGNDKVFQSTCRFAGVKPNDVQEFRLETCPWLKIQFTNISLVSGQHTDCKVLVAASDGMSSGLGTMETHKAEVATSLQQQHEVEIKGYVRPTGHASVSGKVVDAETGEPISGSSVMLFRTDTMDTILIEVAGDGSFEFKDVPGGSYVLRMNAAPDHVTNSEESGGVSFQLGEEEQKRDMVFKLRWGFSISGRVTTEDGSPLPEDKAFVVVAWAGSPTEKNAGRPYRNMVGHGQVDTKDGSYRIRGLDGGPVYVQFMDWNSELKDDPYPPVYYPGTFARDKAATIAFDKTGETEIKNVDIPLRKTGGLVLEGTVTNRDTGEPIPKTLVVVCHRGAPLDRATTYTGAQGRYRFECLGAGEFQLAADATPWGYVRTRKLVTLSDAAPVTRLDLSLMTGATISGVFVQEDGTPWHVQTKRIGGAQIRGSKDKGTQYSGAWNRYAPGRPQFGDNIYSPGEGDCETVWMGFPDDSSFIVSGMMPGQVMFTFNPYTDGKRVVRIAYEGKDVLRDGLDVESKQVVEGVQIVIGAATAQGNAKFDKQADGTLRADCANNLTQMGLVFKMFINEEKTQTYPELSSVPGQLMFSTEAKAYIQNGIVPEFITDTRIFVCPATEEAARLDTPEVRANPKSLASDHSYVYLGYAVTNDAEVKAFADAYRAQMANGSPPLEDLPVPEGMQGSGGGKTLYRLRGGVERRIAKNANDDAEAAKVAAQIPVLIERLGHHETEGGNVLYLDGTVRWVSPGVWPMTTATTESVRIMSGY